MNWLKRTGLSIVRRPLKTLMLGLVVFAMTSLLAGALSIITTTDNVKQEIKRGLGASASIVGNLMDVENKEKVFNDYVSIMDDLSDFEAMDYGEYRLKASGDIYSGWTGSQFEVNFAGVNIPQVQEFRSGEWRLTKQQGVRYFTQEEIDANEYVIIVPDNICSVGSLDGSSTIKSRICEIGNKIQLNYHIVYRDSNKNDPQVFKYPFEATVVGVYQSNRGLNAILPNHVLIEVMNQAMDEFEKEHPQQNIPRVLDIDYAGFKLKDTTYLEEFDQLAQEKMKQLPSSFSYESSSKEYERSAGPVENLDTIARVIFIASIIATVVILGLVVVFFISERKTEIGIYMSLGEKQKHLLTQMICEIVLVSTLSIGVASVSGIYLGNKLSDYMLEVQRYVKRKQDQGRWANLPVVYKPVKDGLTTFTRDDVIDNYENKTSVEYFVTLGVVGEGVVILSCILPMVYMTRLKPKEILIR